LQQLAGFILVANLDSTAEIACGNGLCNLDCLIQRFGDGTRHQPREQWPQNQHQHTHADHPLLAITDQRGHPLAGLGRVVRGYFQQCIQRSVDCLVGSCDALVDLLYAGAGRLHFAHLVHRDNVIGRALLHFVQQRLFLVTDAPRVFITGGGGIDVGDVIHEFLVVVAATYQVILEVVDGVTKRHLPLGSLVSFLQCGVREATPFFCHIIQ
jgi:hypothetical protein